METAGLAGLSDPKALTRIAEDDRIFVAHNLRTMPRHFAALITTRQSAGLVPIPQRLPITSAVDGLCRKRARFVPDEPPATALRLC
jgi:hypothetical protein